MTKTINVGSGIWDALTANGWNTTASTNPAHTFHERDGHRLELRRADGESLVFAIYDGLHLETPAQIWRMVTSEAPSADIPRDRQTRVNRMAWRLLREQLLPMVAKAARAAGIEDADSWDLELTEDGEFDLVLLRLGLVDAVMARFSTAEAAESHLNGMRQAYQQTARRRSYERAAQARREAVCSLEQELADQDLPPLAVQDWPSSCHSSPRGIFTLSARGTTVAELKEVRPGSWSVALNIPGQLDSTFPTMMSAYAAVSGLWRNHWTKLSSGDSDTDN